MQPTHRSSRVCRFSPVLFFAVALPLAAAHAQQLGLDANGDITLTSSAGSRTILAKHDHCNEVMGTPADRTLACFVSRGVDDRGFRPQFEIEVYHADGQTFLLKPGGPIQDWRFQNNYQDISVRFTVANGKSGDALYDAQNGKLLKRIDEPSDLSELPQWAKSPSQIDDESVPTDTASREAQNKWLGKTFRQIQSIKPGMHRRDLATLFREDGGINPIDHQYRYVFKECQIIKIDVQFVLTGKSTGPFPEDPDDVITSVSKPYLQYPYMD